MAHPAPGVFCLAERSPPQEAQEAQAGHEGTPPQTGPHSQQPHASSSHAERARRRALKQAQRRVLPRTASGTHDHTKNEWARALVWQVVRAGLRVRFILFDTWYASRENLHFFARLGLMGVTRLTHHTLVLDHGRQGSVQPVAASVPKATDHDSPQLGARARSFAVELLGQPVKLTVVNNDSHPERDRTTSLATSKLSLSTAEHGGWYRRRWPIECVFRAAKQRLGLGRAQVRQPQPVLTHIVLVCVASVPLQLLKPLSLQPHLSVSQGKKALLPLHLLVTSTGAATLVRLTRRRAV